MLNFLEIACGALDLTLLVLIVWVYRIKEEAEEGMPPGGNQDDVALPQVCRRDPDGSVAVWQHSARMQ